MEFAKVLAVNVTLVHKSLLFRLCSNLKKTFKQEKNSLISPQKHLKSGEKRLRLLLHISMIRVLF